MRRLMKGSLDGAPGLVLEGWVTGPEAADEEADDAGEVTTAAGVAEPVAVEPVAEAPEVVAVPVAEGRVVVVAVEPVGAVAPDVVLRPVEPVVPVAPEVPVTPVVPLVPVVLVDGVMDEPVDVPAAAPLTPVAVVPLAPEVPVVVSVVAGVAALGVDVTVDGVEVVAEVSEDVDVWACATLANASTADPIKSLCSNLDMLTPVNGKGNNSNTSGCRCTP
jgi:hypothetical protein